MKLQDDVPFAKVSPHSSARLGSQRTSRRVSNRQSAAITVANDSHSSAPDFNDGSRHLGFIGMIFLTFVSTSAGPFGIEACVRSGGPIVTAAFVLLVPLVVIVPIILMVSELASWMPSNHGSVRWVHRAFGPFAGFLNGIFQLAMNFIDLSIYPVMATDYIHKACRRDLDEWEKFGMQAAIIVLGTVPCLFNIRGVVMFCTVTSVCILLPFLVGFFAGVDKIDPSSWNDRTPRHINYATLFSTGLWLYNGFVGNSSLAGEVSAPRVFVIGSLSALVIDVLMYALPLVVTLQIVGPWTDGYLSTAFDIVMPGLGLYVSIAGALSAYGLFLSSMACYARTLWGAGDMRWVPSVFGKSHGGAPRVAVVTLALTSLGLGRLGGFSFLVDLEFVIASVIYVLFAASFVTLRYQYPHDRRPFQVPGGKVTAWLLPLPLFVFMPAMMFSSLVHWVNAVAFVATTIVTAALYFIIFRPFVQSNAGQRSQQVPQLGPGMSALQ